MEKGENPEKFVEFFVIIIVIFITMIMITMYCYIIGDVSKAKF